MAITPTIVKRTVYGDTRVVFADLDLGTYATGGVSLTAPDLGYSDALVPRLVLAAPTAGLIFEFDHANSKLKAYYPSGGATAPAALAAPAVAVTAASGETAVTSDAATPTLTAAVTAGEGKEVAASTDLSSLSVRALVVLA